MARDNLVAFSAEDFLRMRATVRFGEPLGLPGSDAAITIE